MIKKFTLLFFLFFIFFIKAQLPSFTITATKVNDETCANNGAISWTTSNTTQGSTLTYSIVNSITNTTVTTLSTTSYNSLAAGTYHIVATQTLGSQTNKATSEKIIITKNIIPLSFNIKKNSDVICGNDGKVTIEDVTGRAPFQYQIIDASGNVVVSQTNNVFSNLSAGDISFRVIDACGNGVVKKVKITKTPSSIENAQYFEGTPSANCTSVTYRDLKLTYSSGGDIKLPITVSVTYTNPNSQQVETVTNTYTRWTGENNSNRLKVSDGITLPNFNVDILPARIRITDGCGKIVYDKDYTFNFEFKPQAILGQAVCGTSYLSFGWGSDDHVKYPFKVNYISGPSGYDPRTTDPNYGNLQQSHKWGDRDSALPPGEYKYEFESQCGQKIIQTSNVSRTNAQLKTDYFPTCEANLGAFRVYINNNGFSFDTVRLVKAPSSYTGTLPNDISSSVADGSSTPRTIFFMDNLPPGEYEFEYNFTCDSTIKTIKVNIPPTKKDSTTTKITVVNCQSFTFDYQLGFGSTSYKQAEIVGLQRYYPDTGHWSRVDRDIAPTADYPVWFTEYFTKTNESGSYTINNLPPAKYRIIVKYQVSFSNSNKRECYIIKDTIDLSAELIFADAYAFQCANDNYDVAISASKGQITNLNYAIVSDASANASVIKDNGNNPIFKNLENGVYYFRVMDACGNFKTRKLDVAYLGKPQIRLVADCSTTPGSLKLLVSGLDYLKYQWTKGSDPTVLSTTSVLDLGPFDASKAGKYKLRIYSEDAATCINSISEIEITEDALTDANSGIPTQPQPAVINYDGSQSKVNLFNYLQEGTYDGFGQWTETTATGVSNLLVGNQWNAFAADSGTYTFRYTVKSLCGGHEESTDIAITLIKVCYKLPVTTGGSVLDTKFGITTLGRAGASRDNWPMLRKGGWMALESNTKGFVLNRVEFDSNNLPIGIPTENFVEGMMVFDTTNKCLKIYNGSLWSCFTTQTCPE